MHRSVNEQHRRSADAPIRQKILAVDGMCSSSDVDERRTHAAYASLLESDPFDDFFAKTTTRCTTAWILKNEYDALLKEQYFPLSSTNPPEIRHRQRRADRLRSTAHLVWNMYEPSCSSREPQRARGRTSRDRPVRTCLWPWPTPLRSP